MCPQVTLSVISRGDQILDEREKAHSRRGGLDLCQESPGEDPRHVGRDSHPTSEEARGASNPGGYPHHPAQDGPKGPGMPGGKNPLYAPRGARGGGPPLSHSACAESGGSGPGVAISVLPLQACQLEGARPPGGIQADALGRNHPSGTHPSRVI